MHMKKIKMLLPEIFRYLLVGGLATVLDYGAFMLFRYVLLLDTTFNLLIATAMGFTVGVITNYILSILFVFKNVADPNKAKTMKSFIIFVIIGIVGLGVTELGMWLNHIIDFQIGGNTYQIPEMVMKVILTLIVLCWNYIARKMLIFTSKKEEGTTI